MSSIHPSRRDFCAGAAKAALAICAIKGLNHSEVFAVPLTTPVVLDLTDPANSALTQAGGAMYVTHPQSPSVPIIVIRISTTEAATFSSSCTHRGCTVGLPAGGALTCPCHGSVFNTQGQVVQGPAASALEQYHAVIQGNTLTISQPDSSIQSDGSANLIPVAPFSIQTRNGIIEIKASSEFTDWSAKVIQADGRIVARFERVNATTLHWNSAGIPSGVYFASVKFNGQQLVRKIATIR